jgi:hypothetical protein
LRVTPPEESGSFDSGASTLFYVVDWLPPDFGAVGQYALMFAREIAQAGRDVLLIGLTSGGASRVCEKYEGGGVLEISRTAAGSYDKGRYLSRLLWTLRTNLRLIWQVIRNPKSRGAEILFTGAPPFMLFFAIVAKYLRHARLTYRITDFYPEVIIAQLGKRPLPVAVFERLTWFMRRRVDTFQVLGEDQRRILQSGGIAPEWIIIKRDRSPVPISGFERPMLRPRELAGRQVLLYSGNCGVAHDVDTVVDGLVRHHRQGSGRFALWLNASGANAPVLESRLRAAGVPIARGLPVPLEQLPALLAAADVHLITLRPQFSGIVLPSKIYACLDSGRPILFVGPKSSDVHLLCTKAERLTYEQVDPADGAGFASALERLAERTRARKSRSNHDQE